MLAFQTMQNILYHGHNTKKKRYVANTHVFEYSAYTEGCTPKLNWNALLIEKWCLHRDSEKSNQIPRLPEPPGLQPKEELTKHNWGAC